MYIKQAFTFENNWWRYLIGVFIIFIFWQFFGAVPLMIAAFMNTNDLNEFMTAAETNFMGIMDANLFLFLAILTFVSGLIGVLITIRFIHNQSLKSLTTAREKVDWRRIGFAFALVATVNIIFFIIGYFIEPEVLQFNFNAIPFLILALISIFLLPLQTSFEEYFFRGYLMQGLGVIFKNKWFPLIFTSVGFGLLHIFNPEVEKLGYISMVYYIGTGFLLGIITLMDDGLELALGFHAANNIIAAMLVTTDWSVFQTDALFIDTSEPTAGFDIILPVLILYPIYLFIFAKKYNWTNWKEKLFGSVYEDSEGVLEE